MRNDDTRCCGTGTCMINAEGFCWCGQRWDGEKMCLPPGQQTPQETQDREPRTAPLAAELGARPPAGLKD